MEVPAGSFRLSKRLQISPTKPFAIKGIAPDVSRLIWDGKATEGITIVPKGCVEPTCNDGSVTVTGVRRHGHASDYCMATQSSRFLM